MPPAFAHTMFFNIHYMYDRSLKISKDAQSVFFVLILKINNLKRTVRYMYLQKKLNKTAPSVFIIFYFHIIYV